MKNIVLNKLYHGTQLGKLLRFCFHYYLENLISDVRYTKYLFKKKMGYTLDLKNPKTLNEKINWLKLFNRTPEHTICADKYLVRNYVIDKIGVKYLVPLYLKTEEPEEINSVNILDTPCIVKTNHDSSGGIFIYDVTKVDWSNVQNKLRKRLSINYYNKSREWQYKNIVPCIIVEKLLIDKSGNIPMDYKLHCFNGIVNMIQVDIGRGTSKHFRNWYSKEWIREPYTWSSPKENGNFTNPSDDEIDRPKTLNKMIELSELMSRNFDYVRVDWYDVDGELYFGEMTFHHDGGVEKILPKEWDLKLGQRLKITSRQ